MLKGIKNFNTAGSNIVVSLLFNNNNLNTVVMKMKFFIAMALVFTLGFLNSCSNSDAAAPPTISFSQPQGTANVQGEYTMTGHIHSDVRLNKVILTKEGASAPFLIDDSTAKNKTDYDYSYLVTGITAPTYIVIDIYNMSDQKTTARFLIVPSP